MLYVNCSNVERQAMLLRRYVFVTFLGTNLPYTVPVFDFKFFINFQKGNTALHIAALAGQEVIVQILIEYKANVNVQSGSGFTPLYMAAQVCYWLINQLINHIIFRRTTTKLSPSSWSTAPIKLWRPRMASLRWLLLFNKVLNQSIQSIINQSGHDRVVAMLLENDTRGKVRLPALHIAAKKDDEKAATLLLQVSGDCRFGVSWVIWRVLVL